MRHATIFRNLFLCLFIEAPLNFLFDLVLIFDYNTKWLWLARFLEFVRFWDEWKDFSDNPIP